MTVRRLVYDQNGNYLNVMILHCGIETGLPHSLGSANYGIVLVCNTQRPFA